MVDQLLSVWGTIGSVLLAILILLVMITIHELGHYIAGKILKFKIDEFAIGFGPAIFKHRRKKSGELFSVRLIPLGGFCSFAGEDGVSESKPPMSETQPPKIDEVPAKTTAGDVVIVTEAPETPPSDAPEGAQISAPEEIPEKNPEKVPEGAPAELVAPAAPPAEEKKRPERGKKKRERLKYDENGLFTHMKPWRRIIVLMAGALMNYFLAILFLIALFFGYGQSVIEVGGAKTSDEYPAEYSFRAGDLLLKADGHNLYLVTDLISVVNGKHDMDEVKFLVSRLKEDGSREEVEQVIRLRAVDRDGNKLERIEVKNSSDYSTVYRALGVGTEFREDGNEYYMLSSTFYRFGFFETIGRSFAYSFKIAGTIFRVIGELFTGRIGINALGGPVTTITAASNAVSAGGLCGFLEIAAFIGVNLAVMNLLPIPALDGSKIVFTLIEWVRGRPINRKAEAIIHAVGLVLLFGFAILVDILQFVL